MLGKYLKLVPSRASLHALEDDIDCFLIGHVFSGVVGQGYYIKNESVLHACAKRMIMSLFGFWNPMAGMTLIIYRIGVIYKKPFIDKMLDALIHH